MLPEAPDGAPMFGPTAAPIPPPVSHRAEQQYFYTSLCLLSVRLGSAQHQHRVVAVAHDIFRDTANHPTPNAGAAVRAHGNQRIGSLAPKHNYFVAGITFFADGGNFADAEVFNFGDFLIQILGGFIARAGN